MRTSTLLAACCLPLVAGPALIAAESGNYTVEGRVGVWLAQIVSGDFSPAEGVPPVKLSDTDLDSYEVGFFVEVGLQPPLPLVPNIHAGYTTWRTDGDDGELTSGDGWLEVSYAFTIGDKAGVAAGLAVHVSDIELENDGPSGYDDSAVTPAVALRAFVHPLDSFDLRARLHWSDFLDDTLIDIEVYGTWYPKPQVGVQAGLKYLDIQLEDDETEFSSALFGPFIAGVVQF